MNLLDRKQYLVTPEDKTKPAGRDGKKYYSVKFRRIAFSQRIIHMDLAVIFKYSG